MKAISLLVCVFSMSTWFRCTFQPSAEYMRKHIFLYPGTYNMSIAIAEYKCCNFNTTVDKCDQDVTTDSDQCLPYTSSNYVPIC